MDTDDHFNPSELADLFAKVVGEAREGAGLITVKVDAAGRVAEVWLDPKVTQISAERLGEVITTLCASAFDNRVDQLADVIDQYERTHDLGPDVLDFLRTSVASLRKTQAVPEETPHEEPPFADDESYTPPSLRAER